MLACLNTLPCLALASPSWDQPSHNSCRTSLRFEFAFQNWGKHVSPGDAVFACDCPPSTPRLLALPASFPFLPPFSSSSSSRPQGCVSFEKLLCCQGNLAFENEAGFFAGIAVICCALFQKRGIPVLPGEDSGCDGDGGVSNKIIIKQPKTQWQLSSSSVTVCLMNSPAEEGAVQAAEMLERGDAGRQGGVLK